MEMLEKAVKENISIMGVMRTLGIKMAGGSHTHISRKIKKLGIDTTHFHGIRANARHYDNFPTRKTADQILVKRSEGYRQETKRLNRALAEIGRKYECEGCKNTGEWQGTKLVLQVDHIDGEFLNDTRENIRFLCPNCHSQTTGFNRPKKYNTPG